MGAAGFSPSQGLASTGMLAVPQTWATGLALSTTGTIKGPTDDNISVFAADGKQLLLDTKNVATDVAPGTSILAAQSAYAQSTVNTGGANLVLAGGIGRRFYAFSGVVGNIAGKTFTITVNGTAVVLTEGTDFARGASMTTAATAFAAAVNANGTLGPLVTATAVTTTVYVQAKPTCYALQVTDNQLADVPVTQGADGVVQNNGVVTIIAPTTAAGPYLKVQADSANIQVLNTAGSQQCGLIGRNPATAGLLIQGGTAAGDVTIAGQDGPSNSPGVVMTARGGNGNGTDKNAGGITLSTGMPTGAGTADAVILSGYTLASGATVQTAGDRIRVVGKTKTLSTTTATPTNFATIALATTLTAVSGTVFYHVMATSAADVDTASGHFDFTAVNKAGTLSVTAGAITDVKANTNGSITSGVTITTSGTTVQLNVTPVFTTIAPTAVVMSYQVMLNGGPATVTVL